MGGNLFGADSLEECLQVVVVREEEGVGGGVVGVDVTFLHLAHLVLVVGLAVFSLVLGLRSKVGFM